MKNEQHVQLTIDFNSNGTVSLNTEHGWTDEFKLVVDCVSPEDALNTARKFMHNLTVVPHGNCCSNEEHVQSFLGYTDTLSFPAKLPLLPLSYDYSGPCNFSIKFEESYLVEFG